MTINQQLQHPAQSIDLHEGGIIMPTSISDIRTIPAILGTKSIHVLALLALMLSACDSNNTEGPIASFSSTTQELTEGESAQIVVQLSEAFEEDVQIPFTVAGSADIAEYIITSSPVTIPLGTLTANIEVTLVDDDLAEEAETITITLEEPDNILLGDPIFYTVTILDND